MTGIGVHTDTTQLLRNIEKIRKDIPELVRTAVERGALIIEGEAKERCPADTGRLRNSITTNSTETGCDVGTNVFYAPYIEYGTGIHAENGNGRETPWSWKGTGKKGQGWHRTNGMPAQPFLRPALDTKKEEVIEEISETFAELLGEYSE